MQEEHVEEKDKYFRIKDLMRELASLNQERIIVLQSDPEGNFYSPCLGMDENCAYHKGDVRKQQLLPQDIKRGFTEEDLAPKEALPCVVLHPMY
jgi:hypothetical protein